MIILKIYLFGVVAGLLYPLMDELYTIYSKQYRIATSFADFKNINYIEAYRFAPFWQKLMVAFIPVFNFIYIFSIIMMLRFLALEGIFKAKRAFIKRLAASKLKHMYVKMWIVKRLFSRYKAYYYSCLENRNPEFANILSKSIIEAMLQNIKKEKEKQSNAKEPLKE